MALICRIFKVHAAPVEGPWLWPLAFGMPPHGYEPTRGKGGVREKLAAAGATHAQNPRTPRPIVAVPSKS
jgi:hypothetical protein